MIKPLHDNVLLKKETIETKTLSGIILSSNEKSADNIGKVIAVGTKEMNVKVGDKVIFDKFATTEVEYLSEKYLLISETKILAIID